MSGPPTRAKGIFLQAWELTTASQLASYFDTQCSGAAELRREVEDLLRHHQGMGGFLEAPPTAVVESAEQLRTLALQSSWLGFSRSGLEIRGS